MEDTWQIGTTSIQEDQWIATGLRFVHWCHASPNVQARQNPNNDPAVRVYQHLEDQLTKAGSDTDDILALTTTREGATNLRNYFSIAGKKANAETAVKVAGATAKHCIVIQVPRGCRIEKGLGVAVMSTMANRPPARHSSRSLV